MSHRRQRVSRGYQRVDLDRFYPAATDLVEQSLAVHQTLGGRHSFFAKESLLTPQSPKLKSFARPPISRKSQALENVQ
jgi:hypothetical protein